MPGVAGTTLHENDWRRRTRLETAASVLPARRARAHRGTTCRRCRRRMAESESSWTRDLPSSNRDGTSGGLDIWRFTRKSRHEKWPTPPEHLGSPINTAFVDSQPTLSRDGGTLVFTSNRPGSLGTLGNTDLWMSTRMRDDRDD